MASQKNGYFVLAIGMVSAAIFFFNTLILPGLFPKLFESDKWTIRKELVWNFGMFITLILGFTLTALAFNITNLQSMTVFRSGALAILPLVLFNLLNYNHSLKSKVAQVIDTGRHWLADDHKDIISAKDENIRIESENGKEFFENELKNIILIQSASNYIEIFYRDGHVVHRQIIRQTLSTVESQLSVFPTIKKCHRCCLVNISQISKLSGTSPNYVLESEGFEIRIPVSRQKITEFKKLLSKD
jgi:hypothetical protein